MKCSALFLYTKPFRLMKFKMSQRSQNERWCYWMTKAYFKTKQNKASRGGGGKKEEGGEGGKRESKDSDSVRIKCSWSACKPRNRKQKNKNKNKKNILSLRSFQMTCSPIYTSQVTYKSLLLHICSSICLSINVPVNINTIFCTRLRLFH